MRANANKGNQPPKGGWNHWLNDVFRLFSEAVMLRWSHSFSIAVDPPSPGAAAAPLRWNASDGGVALRTRWGATRGTVLGRLQVVGGGTVNATAAAWLAGRTVRGSETWRC